jgi:hypothetical protein
MNPYTLDPYMKFTPFFELYPMDILIGVHIQLPEKYKKFSKIFSFRGLTPLYPYLPG